MKIPKVFHPILGVLTGTILFLVGLGILSAVFVVTYKLIRYAKPLLTDVISNLLNLLSQ